MSLQASAVLRASALLAMFAIVLASCSGATASTPRGNARDHTGLAAGHQSGVVYGIVPPQLPPAAQMPRIMRLVSQLAQGKPLIVHLYTDWSQYPSALPALDSEIASYVTRGFLVDLALRYVPPSGHDGDVAGFARYVSAMVAHFASQPSVAYLQVTNEANSPFNAAASDGAYDNAVGALVAGIEAGAAEKARTGSRVRLGFNWFSSLGAPADQRFFKSIGRLGGRLFASEVSWVGIDLYPGTYVPGSLPPPGSGHLAASAASDVSQAIGVLRSDLMPLAGLGSHVAIGVSEIGWATSPPERTFAEQAELVKAFMTGVCSVAVPDNVRFVQWYKLANTVLPTKSSPLSMGLASSAMVLYAGFAAYQAVIAHGCTLG